MLFIFNSFSFHVWSLSLVEWGWRLSRVSLVRKSIQFDLDQNSRQDDPWERSRSVDTE